MVGRVGVDSNGAGGEGGGCVCVFGGVPIVAVRAHARARWSRWLRRMSWLCMWLRLRLRLRWWELMSSCVRAKRVAAARARKTGVRVCVAGLVVGRSGAGNGMARAVVKACEWRVGSTTLSVVCDDAATRLVGTTSWMAAASAAVALLVCAGVDTCACCVGERERN